MKNSERRAKRKSTITLQRKVNAGMTAEKEYAVMPFFLLRAFTMAEILISLTIIGIVAAITLPALQGNIQEKTWNTQKKALYNRMTQALSMLPGLNGYGEYSASFGDDGNLNITKDTASMSFVTEGLSTVLKINNVCNNTNLADCGLPEKYITPAGTERNMPTKLSELNSMFTGEFISGGTTYQNSQKDIDTVATGIETVNGESILVLYNPRCIDDLGEVAYPNYHYTQPYMCANFIYDLNGTAGPNTVGKDIGFITALYPSNTNIVAPIPLATNASDSSPQTSASAACRSQSAESRLPNRDELAAMFYNRDLIDIASGGFWSGSVSSSASTKAWGQSFGAGHRAVGARSSQRYVRCVRR
ncbi:prepilin-type N-terminal cleavage/methylation domain-containing protein [bacterium]|nr:prepilin-type N-terminal cleavage/methylation domain-containing protein [bacterium]